MTLQDYYNSRKDIYYIYTYTDPRTMKIIYIGKGCRGRHLTHWRHVLTGVKLKNPKFESKLKKLLLLELKPIIVKVCYCGDEKLIYGMEESMVDYTGLNNLCNLLRGGGQGSKGKIVSEKTRKLQAKLKTGKNNPNYGKPRSEETKKKISITETGKHVSEETRKKQCVVKSNMSEETKMKMSESGKIKVFLEEHRKNISIGNKRAWVKRKIT